MIPVETVPGFRGRVWKRTVCEGWIKYDIFDAL
jgi:hypothetical protein